MDPELVPEVLDELFTLNQDVLDVAVQESVPPPLFPTETD